MLRLSLDSRNYFESKSAINTKIRESYREIGPAVKLLKGAPITDDAMYDKIIVGMF